MSRKIVQCKQALVHNRSENESTASDPVTERSGPQSAHAGLHLEEVGETTRSWFMSVKRADLRRRFK